ncbi:carboxylesterase/lipase family protein [Rugosimonospora africana]|uniref:Carboxylic ester hydrolase n=1 Tax=Rugosimonospora africana TaxID=556532 RepID=A0A8J3QZQ3_9ACTN|nr:carboxylesterase family protein [Rugosimonospora africana]GIH19878.1 carboxylic ester hydrolase [Rugosimonospora africana]
MTVAAFEDPVMSRGSGVHRFGVNGNGRRAVRSARSAGGPVTARGLSPRRARGRRARAAAGVALLAVVTIAATTISGSTAAAGADAGASAGVVHTRSGAVRGLAAGGVERFLGLPYAAPPVGALRWRSPQPAPTWSGTRDATRSGPPCAQGAALSEASEDCLYLDVTVPRQAPAPAPRPVMVWLHGGGFTQGAGGDYDPTRMASQGGAIVVTVDFRLGIFGFFGHPGLPGSGTFALQDQQAALRWVRDNISAFGGDPHNVTLFGQSGGSVATCAQLTSPPAAGLFQRVIMESGTCALDWPANSAALGDPAGSFFKPVAAIQQAGDSAAAAVDCQRDTDAAELACLRSLPTHALDDQFANFGVAATGTPVLPVDPETALRSGAFHRVPVLSGHTRDEHRLIAGILAAAGWWIAPDEYPALIEQSFGADAPAVLARYPLSRYDNDGALAWSAVFTDRMWSCTQIETENALARYVPTYTYEFADEHAQPFGDLPPDFPAGASHASEVPYLFDVAGRPPITGDGYTDQQRGLAASMIGYWTTFARTGNPSGRGAAWPATRPAHAEQPARRLAPGPGGVAPVDGYAEHQCAFWQTML